MRPFPAIALLAAGVALSPAAHADTVIYDARADFKLSPTNGAWSYGYAPDKQLLTSSFTKFLAANENTLSSLNPKTAPNGRYLFFDNDVDGPYYYNSNEPAFQVGVYTQDQSDASVQRPADEIAVGSMRLSAGQVYVTQLTVGQAGIYNLSGAFDRLLRPLTYVPPGTTVAVSLNDASYLLSPTVVTYTGAGTTQAFDEDGLSLQQGDRIKFLVVGDPSNGQGGHWNTAVGFHATLALADTTAVPEPGTAALLVMAAPFALLRRRRA